MRIAIQRCLAVVVVLAWAHTASAQTADEIIEKSIAAMGGRAALEKVKTRVMTGAISLRTPVGDVAGTIEVTNVAPNKTRTLINVDLTSLGAGPMRLDQRFDGTNGYVLDSLQGDRPMAGDQLASMRASSFPHIFLNYKAMGISVKLTGKEKVGTRDAFVLLLEPSSGPTTRQFVDAENYLPVRAITKLTLPQVGELEQASDVSDFRDVDGVKVPFKVEVSSPVQAFTVVLSKVEQNVPVDDKLFAKP